MENTEATNQPFGHDLKSVRILYNPYNIDSTYATCIAINRLKHYDNHLRVETVAIDFNNHPKPSNKVDLLINMGVHLSLKDLYEEINQCDPKGTLIFQYLDYKSGPSMSSPNDGYITVITPLNIDSAFGQDSPTLIDIENSADNSLSILVNEYLIRQGVGDNQQAEGSRLMTVISNYMNMKRFSSIFMREENREEEKSELITSGKIIRRDQNDLAFLNHNIREIKASADESRIFTVCDNGDENIKHFMRDLKSIRNIITRNMSEKMFSSKNKYFKAPTVCVGEENAVEVMRQLSLAFGSVVTYEDIQDFRIWRLYATDPQVIEIFKEVINPVRSWKDCQIQYFAAEIPKANDKVSS